VRDNDITQDQGPPPDELEPIDRFYSALATVHRQLPHLHDAICYRDPARASDAATLAYAAWIDAAAAHQQLESWLPSSPSSAAPRFHVLPVALQASRQLLDALLRRTMECITVPTLHLELANIRMGLAIHRLPAPAAT
jgi:hypothetical protein